MFTVYCILCWTWYCVLCLTLFSIICFTLHCVQCWRVYSVLYWILYFDKQLGRRLSTEFMYWAYLQKGFKENIAGITVQACWTLLTVLNTVLNTILYEHDIIHRRNALWLLLCTPYTKNKFNRNRNALIFPQRCVLLSFCKSKNCSAAYSLQKKL